MQGEVELDIQHFPGGVPNALREVMLNHSSEAAPVLELWNEAICAGALEVNEPFSIRKLLATGEGLGLCRNERTIYQGLDRSKFFAFVSDGTPARLACLYVARPLPEALESLRMAAQETLAFRYDGASPRYEQEYERVQEKLRTALTQDAPSLVLQGSYVLNSLPAYRAAFFFAYVATYGMPSFSEMARMLGYDKSAALRFWEKIQARSVERGR